ncbi:MAG: ROK family protein [Oscillospiraceae bacterium]|nr:ROK family protein [Oscillospiraceae bacterium]
MKKYIGVDIGGTNIACGIVDESGAILHKKSIKTNSDSGYETVTANTAALIQSTLAHTGTNAAEIVQIGVGVPGCCNKDTGKVELCVNLGWRNVPLVQDLQTLTGISPVVIENDANAAAYGEFVAGAAKGANSAVAITLGTGVGSGIIIDGKILRGENFAGGELGHMVISADARDNDGHVCGCGRVGCFESYSSATGLVRMTKSAMAANPDSLMHAIREKYGKDSARTAWEAAAAGDAAGAEVVKRYIAYLACGIANVINIFQPDIVCIGGGICGERDKLLLPLQKLVGEQVYSRETSDKNTRIAICELGNDAGIIGAALCK